MKDNEIKEDTNVKFMDDEIKKNEDDIKKNKGKEIRHNQNKENK